MSAPVVRGDAAYETRIARLAAFLERHAYMGRADRWTACLCGWGHESVTHAEHVAAVMAAQRPWDEG
jgi:hypothetical protein